MLSRLRARLTYANVMATVAVFIALGGSSYAALSLPKNSVGANQLKQNSVGAGEVKNRSLGLAEFKNSARAGFVGQQGATGPQGPKGDKGDPATTLWAEVAPNGSLLRGSGVASSSYLTGTAAYEVVFNQSVADCALIVTPRLSTNEIVERIGAFPYTGRPASVYVRPRLITGGGWNQEHGFYLAVFC